MDGLIAFDRLRVNGFLSFVKEGKKKFGLQVLCSALTKVQQVHAVDPKSFLAG